MPSAAAPIAVVGQGCALPGALSPQALWERVARGDVEPQAGVRHVWPGKDRIDY